MLARDFECRASDREWEEVGVGWPQIPRKTLVNAEVVGDSVYACEPEDKQRDGERADEGERNHAEACDSGERELPRVTGQPPGPYVSREWFERHRTSYYAACATPRASGRSVRDAWRRCVATVSRKVGTSSGLVR